MDSRKPFDPQKQHKYVRYLRVSSKRKQCCPQKQAQEIERVREQHKYPWIHVRDYRDDAISAGLQYKRSSFDQMLNDIKTGRIKPDLILIDTSERLGRSDKTESIRQELIREYGVFVLTADSGFCDPSSLLGRILTLLDGIYISDLKCIRRRRKLR
ncbi:MAG TPA: recombinase family protein [Gemmatales bacterium]|nr:recombinase family protein [Gemmatales bacterium]